MSRYVIYDKITTLYPTELDGAFFHSEDEAYRWIARVAPHLVSTHDVAELDHFQANIEKTKTVRNWQTGKPITIGVNTPPEHDPSCEEFWTYW